MPERKFFREDFVLEMLKDLKAKVEEESKKRGDRMQKLWQESAEIHKDALSNLQLLLTYLFMGVEDDYIEECLKMIDSEVAINTARLAQEIARDVTEGN